MNIGVLGTGVVGNAIGTRLCGLGHRVMMGSRSAANDKAVAWAQANSPNASQGSFADAATFGELVVNCTAGGVSLDALSAAGADNLAGKVLIDISNSLDFSAGMPPRLSVCNTDSVAEQIQRAFPQARVVKTLNTMNCDVMVDPGRVDGDHNVFVSGDDATAKESVIALLESFGWRRPNIIDLGGIGTARGAEMYIPLWLALMSATGGHHFNIAVRR